MVTGVFEGLGAPFFPFTKRTLHYSRVAPALKAAIPVCLHQEFLRPSDCGQRLPAPDVLALISPL